MVSTRGGGDHVIVCMLEYVVVCVYLNGFCVCLTSDMFVKYVEQCHQKLKGGYSEDTGEWIG